VRVPNCDEICCNRVTLSKDTSIYFVVQYYRGPFQQQKHLRLVRASFELHKNSLFKVLLKSNTFALFYQPLLIRHFLAQCHQSVLLCKMSQLPLQVCGQQRRELLLPSIALPGRVLDHVDDYTEKRYFVQRSHSHDDCVMAQYCLSKRLYKSLSYVLTRSVSSSFSLVVHVGPPIVL
jgi:hypothetical protein